MTKRKIGTIMLVVLGITLTTLMGLATLAHYVNSATLYRFLYVFLVTFFNLPGVISLAIYLLVGILLMSSREKAAPTQR